ncbi:MAG: ATP-dependent metallopeptidase FtsH/Yme1/Tma family protein, partial [Thermodesulfobacteriota bacterium]
MEKHHKFSLWYFVLAVWGVLLLQRMLFSALSVKTLPYSEFLGLLDQNKVAQVAITQNQIEGKLKTGPEGKPELFRTVRVDEDLSKLLAQHNVVFAGEIESTFLKDILSWIVPVLLFVGIWAFLMKRMMPNQQGFMMLGKKAKIYMENEIDVTFADAAGVDEAKMELVEVVE